MFSSTLATCLLASMAALSLSAPIPGIAGDGVDIRFTQLEKINDNEFKATTFNVHDRTEHDKHFEQVEAKNKDLLEAVVFEKEDGERFIFHKRQVAIDAETDLIVDSAFSADADSDSFEDLSIDDSSLDLDFESDTSLGADVSFGFDLNQSIDVAFSDADLFDDLGSLVKRGGGGDGEDIRVDLRSLLLSDLLTSLSRRQFIEIKAITEDKFKKTNFNVHDATEHDANFNQVEAKDRDVIKVVDFRKDEDDDFGHRRFRGGKKGGDYY